MRADCLSIADRISLLCYPRNSTPKHLLSCHEISNGYFMVAENIIKCRIVRKIWNMNTKYGVDRNINKLDIVLIIEFE